MPIGTAIRDRTGSTMKGLPGDVRLRSQKPHQRQLSWLQSTLPIVVLLRPASGCQVQPKRCAGMPLEFAYPEPRTLPGTTACREGFQLRQFCSPESLLRVGSVGFPILPARIQAGSVAAHGADLNQKYPETAGGLEPAEAGARVPSSWKRGRWAFRRGGSRRRPSEFLHTADLSQPRPMCRHSRGGHAARRAFDWSLATKALRLPLWPS